MKKREKKLKEKNINHLTIDDLLCEVLVENSKELTELQFNLYEDQDCYTIEACFDDDVIIIGRECPFFCGLKDRSYEEVLQEIQQRLKEFCTSDRARLNNLKEISYGFVDGELNYIKKKRKSMKKSKTFTAEDFVNFDDVKLLAWLSVYTNREKRKQNGIETLVSGELTEDQRADYRNFLAENFDYTKYE